ncbi:hypothetical protein Q8F57_000370 [Paraburkholderia terrae]|uniref:hypothetical protein n=1 Tax=Paraburkholderia terrae TaxID=311230 RepID=UPI00296ACD79|nr:hypothetical protein [Paraburkholderia terrae]MDW3660572.1 hypothetical protein [Paraburkholderia terrae]
MLDYKEKTVLEIAGCTCDRCRQRTTPDEFEFHEWLSVNFVAGFDSIFGDGNVVSIDLCPRCLQETLGNWLHITHP